MNLGVKSERGIPKNISAHPVKNFTEFVQFSKMLSTVGHHLSFFHSPLWQANFCPFLFQSFPFSKSKSKRYASR